MDRVVSSECLGTKVQLSVIKIGTETDTMVDNLFYGEHADIEEEWSNNWALGHALVDQNWAGVRVAEDDSLLPLWEVHGESCSSDAMLTK